MFNLAQEFSQFLLIPKLSPVLLSSLQKNSLNVCTCLICSLVFRLSLLCLGNEGSVADILHFYT